MKNISGYFPGGTAQKAWGLYVTCAGIGRSEPGAEFPSHGHPDGYYFTWERGRVLHEWQLILLEEGRGEVEFRDGKFRLDPGSLLALAPNDWHRYRPDSATGWTTRWIGFSGDMASRLMGCAGLGGKCAVRSVADVRHLRDLFAETVAEAIRCGLGHPFSVSASLFAFLAELAESPSGGKGATRTRREEMVREAKAYIAAHCDGIVDFNALAERLGLPYRTFRHVFAKECGMPPLRYQQNERLARAKNLLVASDMPVAEIASSLGFNSPWHFAHFFQRETGCSAVQYRNRSAIKR